MPSPENMEENKMEQYKKEFIEFMVESQVLKFGEFTLKSGRKSPFFMNAGAYVTGSQLKRLGEYYAKAIHDNYGLDFDVLFGPAYKGIPLSVVTAIAIHDLYGVEVRYCSNRKEVKDHGEGGMFVGKQLADGDKVVIIEDVMTSGKALREVIPKLKGAADVNITAMVITVDRMEKALDSDLSAVQSADKDFGVKVYSIVNINDIISAIENGVIEGKQYLDAMKQYRSTYGVEY